MRIRKIEHETSVLLDFVRGISAQLVVLGHLVFFFGYNKNIYFPTIQNFGVLVFFILSGFLISQTTFLKEEKGYTFWDFFLDRFSRIFFTFIPALIFILIIDYNFVRDYSEVYNMSPKNFFFNFFMIQGLPFGKYLGIEAFGSARPFWTVSVEWWFYIFFGIVFYRFYSNKKIDPFQWPFLIVSSAFVLYYFHYRGDGLTIYWFFGLVLSILYNQSKFKLKLPLYIIITIFAFSGLLIRMYFFKDMYDVGLAAMFAILLFINFNPPEEISKLYRNLFFSKISKFLANYSYSLYLLHYSIIVLYIDYFPQKTILNFAIIFILSNLISYIFYLFFEKKHYLFKNLISNYLLKR